MDEFIWKKNANSFLSPRVWRLRQVPISADDSHLVPLLQNPNNHLAARRVQAWLVAYLVHSLTLILHKYKVIFLPGDMGLWRLFSQCPSPFFALIVSAVLLGILVWHYPISEVKHSTEMYYIQMLYLVFFSFGPQGYQVSTKGPMLLYFAGSLLYWSHYCLWLHWLCSGCAYRHDISWEHNHIGDCPYSYYLVHADFAPRKSGMID